VNQLACERYLNAINELVDGTLGPLRRAELDLHIESCEACRALVADLQQIAQTARTLGTLEPPDRVWTRIAAGLHQEGRVPDTGSAPGRRSHTMLALAATLALAVGGSLWMLLPRQPAPVPAARTSPADVHDPPAGSADPDDPVQGVVASELAATEQHFKKAIDEASKNGDVDPDTAAELQKQFLVMTNASAEIRKVLETDPQDSVARQSLYDMLKQKIRFLQDTIALMNQMRKGDAAGAAELIEGGKS
jgi:hypothetical protein